MELEPLLQLSPDQWGDLQREFKLDWPRGCPGYYLLETQMKWLKCGLDYGFKVFCPFGKARHGMVALNDKKGYYEVVVQCPTDDTKILEESLSKTKLIDWARSIVVPFAPDHVVALLQRVIPTVSVDIDFLLPSRSFIKDKHSELFDVSLPDGVQFSSLRPEHVEVVNSNWHHRYNTSSWYFHQLIKANTAYGLFKNSQPIAWIFIYEHGTIGNLYTVEAYRRRGYAEILLKILCNILFREGKDAFAFSVKGNDSSGELFKKIGFENFGQVTWCYLKPKAR